MQPLAFSKELLPVGSRVANGVEGPRAVSEYLVERLLEAGAEKLCFVIGPGKWDILSYYGKTGSALFVVQPQPAGLCDALFRPAGLIGENETVLIGLPDTIWFPSDGLRSLPEGELVFLLFPVEEPELFDAVVVDREGRIERILVKEKSAKSRWIWGACRLSGRVYHRLHKLWIERGQSDQFLGTLINAYLAQGGHALGSTTGRAYVDVGTVDGYRRALQLLGREQL